MASVEGTHTLGPHAGRLLLRTGRTGLGSRAGHDLTIEVTRWEGTATVDTGEPARSSVTIEAHVDSFVVREGSGGVKPLTDSDRADIKKTIEDKVLQAKRHPTITFRSNRVSGAATSFTVVGDLTIVGTTRPVTVRGSLTEDSASGSASVVQSQYGIKPYSAFLGALKLADEVTVEFDMRLGGENG